MPFIISHLTVKRKKRESNQKELYLIAKMQTNSEKIGETEIISYENVEKNNFITEYLKMFKNVFRCCI